MKRCSKCKKIRKDKDFYSSDSLKGKLSSACIYCTRARARKRAREKKYNRLCSRLTQAAYREGLIPKSQCQDLGCSLMKVQGHHWDYMRPLDVIWLCASHHRIADCNPTYEKPLIENRYNHNFYYINQYFT